MKTFKQFINEAYRVKHGFPNVVNAPNMLGGFETNVGPHTKAPKPGRGWGSARNTYKDSPDETLDTTQSYSAQDIKTVKTYQSGGTRYFNSALRHANERGKKPPRVVQRTNDALMNVSNRNKTTQDMYVYHGGETTAQLLKAKPNEHGVIEHTRHSWTSTSLSHSTAIDFARREDNPANKKGYRHVMKIHVPKGSGGFWMPSTFNNYDSEREFVLPPQTKLRIDPKPTYDNDKGLVTWHAEASHVGGQPTRHEQRYQDYVSKKKAGLAT